jgi:carboxylesterase
LILQAREDDITGPRNGELVYNDIASIQKLLILLDDCYHVITVDKQKKAVADHLIEFFARQAVSQGHLRVA